MMKIAIDKWNKNKNVLKLALSNLDHFPSCYAELVGMAFKYIWNTDALSWCELDIEAITEIDNGDYQGTYIYLIPFDTYQPSEWEYLMTFAGYGSCSCCDALQRIENLGDYSAPPNDVQVKELLQLCKDIICNTIRPYNNGWYHESAYDDAEMKN